MTWNEEKQLIKETDARVSGVCANVFFVYLDNSDCGSLIQLWNTDVLASQMRTVSDELRDGPVQDKRRNTGPAERKQPPHPGG